MSDEPIYRVVAPTGRIVEDEVAVNVHPTSLSSKTIGFVWDHLFMGPVFFDVIRGLINARFSDVRYIDYDYFGDIHGVDSTRVMEELPEKLRAAGVDVAVVAVGA
jgi:hypothetical protein